MSKVVALFLVAIMFLTSCATLVRIETNVPDATVKLDGQVIGKTPLETKLSDGIWEKYYVVIEKPGYSVLRSSLRREFKVGTFIGGLFIWPLLLWTYGPEPYQNFEIQKE
jgi:hypothetical protein